MLKKIKEFYLSAAERYVQFYHDCERWFCEKKSRLAALKILNKATTYSVYAAYVVLLGYLGMCMDKRIYAAVIVPAAAFLIVTIVRKKINAPRPYEREDITSLVKKNTKGNSCPSRHTACAFIIALAWLYISVPVGIAMLLVAAVIAVIRPVMGVHYPLDTMFGAAMSILIGVIGFWVLF